MSCCSYVSLRIIALLLNAVYDYTTNLHAHLRSAFETTSYEKYISIEMRGTDAATVGHVTKALSFLQKNYS